MSAINTMIAQMGQKNPLDGFKNGQALRQLIGVNLSHKMDMMPEAERQDYANNSFFGRELNAHLRAQQAAKLKAEQDALKFNADLQKTESETLKNNSQAQGYGLDNSAKIISAAENAISHSAATGTKGGALASLGRLRDAGLITPEFYESEARTIESFTNPAEFKAYATSMLDPKYWMQTVDNAANNAQSDINSQRSNETSRLNNQASVAATMRGQDIGAATAAANRQQQLTIEQARIKMQQEGGSVQVFGGKAYFIDKQGNAKPVSDENGQHLTAPQNNAGTISKIADLQEDNDNESRLISTLEKAKELSEKGIYHGYTSQARADLRGNIFGGSDISRRTQEYNNLVMGQALQSLKSIFGGNPTEGERAILLKIQASSSYPPEVRKSILEEAISMANSRIESNNRKMNTLRGDDVANPFMTERESQKGGKPNARSFFD